MLTGKGGTGKAWSMLQAITDIALEFYRKEEDWDWKMEQRRLEDEIREKDGMYNSERTRLQLIERYQDRPLFTRYDSWFRRILKRLCDKAGIDYKTVHGLRHSFATEPVRSGWSMPQLALWLGHQSVATTFNRYSHLTKTRPPEFWYRDNGYRDNA